MPSQGLREELAEARAGFRTRIEQAGAEVVWQKFAGRIGVVLSGGGPRGAYQAGVLLAFQDARIPTHIITATSIGSINAVGYTARSEGFVGNAELLVDLWLDGNSSQSTGVEWARYGVFFAGLVVILTSLANYLGHELTNRNFLDRPSNPALGWTLLGVAGVALLLLHPQIPYLGSVLRGYFHNRTGVWNWRLAAVSLAANLVVWGCGVGALYALRVPALVLSLRSSPRVALLAVAAIVAFVWSSRWWRPPVGKMFRRFARFAMPPGLFPNLAREQLIKSHVTNERLREIPIRLIFTASDLESGTPRFFSNTPPEVLSRDPNSDPRFVRREVCTVENVIGTVVASSAVPMAFEPVQIEGRYYVDGGLCANQPIRPAVRLGADALFVVMVQTPGGRQGFEGTFLQVGMRSFSILMEQSLITDMRASANKNAACERLAFELGLNPEEVEIEMGTRRYRYIPAFAICPVEPLPFRGLDFDGRVTGPMILQGYRDACAQIVNFLVYAREARFGGPRKVLTPGARSASASQA